MIDRTFIPKYVRCRIELLLADISLKNISVFETNEEVIGF